MNTMILNCVQSRPRQNARLPLRSRGILVFSRAHSDLTRTRERERKMERNEVWKGPNDRGQGEKRRGDPVQRRPEGAGEQSRSPEAKRGEEGGLH